MLVKQGMPWGSIVRPILFVFFIDDLPWHVTNSDVDIYADYSTITFSSRWNAIKSFMEKNVNKALGHVVNWSKMNIMVISQTKTKSMLGWESDNGNVWTVLEWIWISLWVGLLLNRLGISFFVFIKTKIWTLRLNQMLSVNRYQRKLDFSSTLVHTWKDHKKGSAMMLYLNNLSFMDECVVIHEQGKFGHHSQTSKEGSKSDPECTF